MFLLPIDGGELDEQIETVQRKEIKVVAAQPSTKRKVRRWIVRHLTKAEDKKWKDARFNLVHGSVQVLLEIKEAYQR